MAKILVKVPRTTNGINPLYDNGKPVYKEMILPLKAQKPLERINEQLPEHLRRVISLVPEPSVEPAKPSNKPQ